MKVLQVNIADSKGGACVISWNLHKAFQQAGLDSHLAVKQKFTTDPHVFVTRQEGPVVRALNRLADRVDQTNFFLRHKAAALIRILSRPARMARKSLGIEEFDFPALRVPPGTDIVHCHILHGDYFNLHDLVRMSGKMTVIVTLHDAWMLSGHCAHSFDCELWKSGCSRCPDITIPVAIQRDNAAFNWRRKRNVYRKCRLYVSTPCTWLMKKVDESILNPACIQKRVIPNGTDQTIFKPGDRMSARRQLGLDDDAILLLFSANGITNSRWKDYPLMKSAVEIIGSRSIGKKLIFLALGQEAPGERLGNAEIRFVPFVSRSQEVALYYQASDIYLHGAKAETFPNAILEALACGVPVVATAVGGIPEQINGWNQFRSSDPGTNSYALDEATGILVPPGNAELFASAVDMLILDSASRANIGENAAREAKQKFSLEKQVASYLEWYKEIVADATDKQL